MAKNWWDDLEDGTEKPSVPVAKPISAAPSKTNNKANWWDDLEDGTEKPVYKPIAAPTVKANTNTAPESFTNTVANIASKEAVKSVIPLARQASTVWDLLKHAGTHSQPSSNEIAGSIARGVPIARSFIPESKEDTQFKAEHPNYELGGNVVGSTLPAAFTAGIGAPSAAASVGAPTNLGQLGVFGQRMLEALKWGGAQAGINTGINTADRIAANPDITAKELVKPAIKDAVISGLTPVASRLLSPSAFQASGTENALDKIQRTGVGGLKEGVGKVGDYIGRAAPGNIIGSIPFIGEPLNQAVKGVTGWAGKNIAQNQLVGHNTAAMLAALAGGSHRAKHMMDER